MVKPDEATRLTERLHEAVRRPDLQRLASNPLLLTVMALVHTHKGRLPDARALLYEETVDILLRRWEEIKTGGEEGELRLRRLLLDADRTDVDLKKVLWRLAFEAHQQGGTTDDREPWPTSASWRCSRRWPTYTPPRAGLGAARSSNLMRLRAGLLVERELNSYTFPHRTFQEYLAGAHLAAQADFATRPPRWPTNAISGGR